MSGPVFDKASVELEAREEIEAARETWPSDMRAKFDPPKLRHANRRRTGKEVRVRRGGVMKRLGNGPWPTRDPMGLSGAIFEGQGERTLRFLEADGLVERFTDESGTENWRLK